MKAHSGKDVSPERRSGYTISASRSWLDFGLGELWSYRQLLFFFVWRDVKVRYKQTLIGMAWAVIQPFATMVVFAIFFKQFLGLPSGGLPAPVFYYVTLLPWIYFSDALANSTSSLVNNQGIIQKIYLPKLILPTAGVMPGLIDFGIAFVLLVVLLLIYGVVPSIQIIFLPFFILLAAFAALAAGLWLSILNAIYRDVRYALPFLTQLWFFLSPVVYPASSVPAEFRGLYALNPMVGVIEGFRWAVTGTGPAPPGLGLSVTILFLGLIGGYIFFRRREPILADIV